MTLEWRTDDDAEELLVPPPPGDPRRGPTRRILWLLATLLFIALAAFVAWRTVDRRAAETEAAIIADVLAVHDLAQRAAAAGDDELYLSLIAPPHDAWRAAHRELLQQNLLYTGSARFYDLLPLPNTSTTPDVTIDPDLRHATVAIDHTFALTTTAPPDGGVLLRQIQTYTLGPGGWQLAPPPPDFWLPQIRLVGDRVILEYPERDDVLARRLFNDLEQAVNAACALPGLSCPADLQLTVHFVSDPATLARAAAPEAMLHATTHIELPSPTLVGQPLDEAAARNVARAYTAHAIAPLISHLAGYQCCTGSLMARAVIERQLHHLDLQPWPLTADDYETLMEEGLTLGNALVLQRRDVAQPLPYLRRQSLALIEFLESSFPPGALLQNVGDPVDAWVTGPGNAGRFVTEWSDFTYIHSRSARLAQTLTLQPRGTLQLTCFESTGIAVIRHDLQQAAWQHAFTHVPQDGWHVDAVFPLSSGDGDVIKESRRDNDAERHVRYLWRYENRSEVILETNPDAATPSIFDLTAASSSALAALTGPNDAALRASLQEEWWPVNLELCDGERCQIEQRLVRPHWSPDGARLLLELRPDFTSGEPQEQRLILTGNLGQNNQIIGPGFAPVWLDNTRYAFLRNTGQSATDEILIAHVDDPAPQTLLTAPDLAAHLPRPLEPHRQLRLLQIHPVPGDPLRLIVQTNTDLTSDYHLFALDLDPTPQIQHLQDSNAPLRFTVSSSGRWLAVTAPPDHYLLDLHNQSSRRLGSAAPPVWSPTGDWLAQWRNNDLLLQHAELDYKRPIVQDLSDCYFSTLQWHPAQS